MPLPLITQAYRAETYASGECQFAPALTEEQRDAP